MGHLRLKVIIPILLRNLLNRSQISSYFTGRLTQEGCPALMKLTWSVPTFLKGERDTDLESNC